MIGYVDEAGRALLSLSVSGTAGSPSREIMVWIDTGFNGDLVLPRQQIEELKLPQSSNVKAILADGSQVTLKTYTCILDWFGQARHLEIVANEGAFPLLGVGLLLGHDLQISYRTADITLD